MKIGRKLFLGGKGDEKLSQNPTDAGMTNGVILKRRMRVQELQIIGYSQEKIAEKVGTSVRNVQRDIEWLRKENEQWFKDLAKKNYASVFREALEGSKQDMVMLREMLEDEQVQQDKYLQLKIIKTISYLRGIYTKNLAAFPYVWSLDALIKKCPPEPIPQPIIPSLGGISGVKHS